MGKNGAGKSTLLKILSKITPPTTGSIVSRGRIASLLEVGTGFHPELTGRENIYMNGSILGMKRSEIKRNFDAIVDFAGVEKFIETPLKHYSSGMQLRLAFAVSAFLENEILIIDEVLAVGDVEFQKKCMRKMEDVSQSGRTILFVSHNTSAIQNLCKTCVYLESGRLKLAGPTEDIIRAYHYEGMDGLENDLNNLPRAGYSNTLFRFTRIRVTSSSEIFEGDTVRFTVEFATAGPVTNLGIGFSLTDHLNTNLVECKSYAPGNPVNISKQGNYSAQFSFRMQLKSGVYSLNLGSKSNEGLLETLLGVLLIEVRSKKQDDYDSSSGCVVTESTWEFSVN